MVEWHIGRKDGWTTHESDPVTRYGVEPRRRVTMVIQRWKQDDCSLVMVEETTGLRLVASYEVTVERVKTWCEDVVWTVQNAADDYAEILARHTDEQKTLRAEQKKARREFKRDQRWERLRLDGRHQNERADFTTALLDKANEVAKAKREKRLERWKLRSVS